MIVRGPWIGEFSAITTTPAGIEAAIQANISHASHSGHNWPLTRLQVHMIVNEVLETFVPVGLSFKSVIESLPEYPKDIHLQFDRVSTGVLCVTVSDPTGGTMLSRAGQIVGDVLDGV